MTNIKAKKKTNHKLNPLVTKANDALRQGSPQVCIDLLNQFSEDLSPWPDLHRLFATAKLMQGLNAEALFIFKQLEGVFSDDVEFLNLLGVASRRESDLLLAKQTYEKALSIAPSNVSVLSNYGNLLIDLNLYSEARQSLSKALDLDPGHKDALVNLNRLQLKEQSGTPSTTNPSLPTTPEPHLPKPDLVATDWIQLANIAYRNKQWTELKYFCEQASNRQPDLSASYRLASEAFLAENHHLEAERLLLYALHFGDHQADIFAALANIHLKRSSFSLCKHFCNSALNLQPQHKLALSISQSLESSQQPHYDHPSV